MDVAVETARWKFAEWGERSEANDDWLGSPRFLACVMVRRDYLDSVLEGPPAEEFDADGEGFLALMSARMLVVIHLRLSDHNIFTCSCLVVF